MFVSCSCVSCLSLKPDEQIEMNIDSLYEIEKKLRDMFFDGPIVVKNSLVSLPALIADGLFIDIFLSGNWT